MTVASSQVVRELIRYIGQHPTEEPLLLPLYDAIRDHVQRRQCIHQGRCPVVTAGALITDEHSRFLTLWNGEKWAFAEGFPEPQDDSLCMTARRSLMEQTGFFDVWRTPGEEMPLIIDVSEAPAEYGPRTRFGFRYLFRTHSAALCLPEDSVLGARWVPLDRAASPTLSALLRDRLLVVN